MLFKLSLRNARRQAGSYLVYFITITLAAALIYAFNGLVGSKEIRNLSELMDTLPLIIFLASIVVVAIMGWLVHYTMRFMLTKRSRELGTYILMGIENGQVARLFFLENVLIGAIALVIGSLLGNLIFQGMRAIILNLFQQPFGIRFTFSLKALGLTLLYFMLIYAFALWRSRRRIRKMKIHGLLYYDRQNESGTTKKRKTRHRLFVISIISGIIGTGCMMTGSLELGILGAALVIFFMYGFFINFAAGVPVFFDKHPSRKYWGINLQVFRALTSKMTSMGATMATIAVLITATLISVGTGLLFMHAFQKQAELYTSFDFYIGNQSEERSDYSGYIAYLHDHVPVLSDHQYDIYFTGSSRTMDYLKNNTRKYYNDYDGDTVMKYSDYSKLRKMLGYHRADLPDDGYIIHCAQYLEKAINKFEAPFELSGYELTRAGVYTELFTQQLWNGNGGGFIFVVPDKVITDQERAGQCYGAMTAKPIDKAVFADLEAMRDEKVAGTEFNDLLLSPDEIREENATMYAVIIFPLFYLALILTMAIATILTIQLLSDVNRYRDQFRLLGQLGQAPEDMRKSVKTQFAIYYSMPVIPSLVISVAFLAALGQAYDPGVFNSNLELAGVIAIAIGIFAVIYLLYIVASYISFKKSVF